MAGKDCFVVLDGDNFNYYYTGPGVIHISLSNNQHLEDTPDEKPSTVPETKNDEHFDADDRKDLIANLDPLTVLSEIEIEQDSVTEDSEFVGNTDNSNSQKQILRRSKRIQEQRRNQEFKKKQTEVLNVPVQNSKSKKKGRKKSKVKNNTRKNPTASTSRMISERNSESCEKERKKSLKKNNTRKYKEPFYFASTSITRAFESVPESIVRINNEDGETIVTFKMRDREDLVEIPEENLTQNMREMLIAYYDNHARRLREGFVTPEAGTSAEDNQIAVDPRIPNTKLEKRSTVGYKEKQLSIFNNSEHFKTRNCSLETKVGI